MLGPPQRELGFRQASQLRLQAEGSPSAEREQRSDLGFLLPQPVLEGIFHVCQNLPGAQGGSLLGAIASSSLSKRPFSF